MVAPFIHRKAGRGTAGQSMVVGPKGFEYADPSPVAVNAPFTSAAQAVDTTLLFGSAPVSGTVTEVRLRFVNGFTGAATDTRTFQLFKMAKDGQSLTLVAEAAAVGTGFSSGFDDGSVAIPIVNGAINAGDGLKLLSTHIGAGKLHSAGAVTVTIKPS